jgi:chromosome segregation ATPase
MTPGSFPIKLDGTEGSGAWERKCTLTITKDKMSEKAESEITSLESRLNRLNKVLREHKKLSQERREQIDESNSELKAALESIQATAATKTADIESKSGVVWCATADTFTMIEKSSCTNQGGKAFETQSQASAFRNKLRAESSSYSSTASSKKKVWCATKYAAWSSVKGCRSGVKAFSTEAQAKAEHKRLKGGSSSYSSTASSK